MSKKSKKYNMESSVDGTSEMNEDILPNTTVVKVSDDPSASISACTSDHTTENIDVMTPDKIHYDVPYQCQVKNNSGSIPIFKFPSDKSEVIGRFNPGDTYVIVCEYQDSKFAELLTGGYVQMFIDKCNISHNFTITEINCRFRVRVKGKGTQIYSGAGASYNQIGYIPSGSIITVISEISVFGFVTYNGVDGWINLNDDNVERTSDTLTEYRVQIGSFSNPVEAEVCKENAIKLGFTNAFVIFADDAYRVHIGTYRNKASARIMTEKAKSSGFSTAFFSSFER